MISPTLKISWKFFNLTSPPINLLGAAAKIYFSKQVSQLTIDEMALLAGLVKAPSRLAPTNNTELAMKRRNLVFESDGRA